MPRKNNVTLNRALARGAVAYEDVLGRWWHARVTDRAHAYAYRRIASYLKQSFPRPPSTVIDYACGPGTLLLRLADIFPLARFIGVDGSAHLLHLAQLRLMRAPAQLRRRVTLMRTYLPDDSLSRARAELVIFAFPNMIPEDPDPPQLENRFEPEEWRLAQQLAGKRPRESGQRQGAAQLLYGRSLARNMRSILRTGGYCVRVEYAGSPRSRMTRAEYLETAFEEGSFPAEHGGPKPWFRAVASSFFRSRVISDVYEQTLDPRDRNGGYHVTILRAL
jgi:hypothetical protein